MRPFEYIRIRFDWGDISKLNELASVGWKVVAVERMEPHPVNLDLMPGTHWALLEREISQAK